MNPRDAADLRTMNRQLERDLRVIDGDRETLSGTFRARIQALSAGEIDGLRREAFRAMPRPVNPLEAA